MTGPSLDELRMGEEWTGTGSIAADATPIAE
jgi:hypothetical protein